ncbi:MAG: diguanylate cyclase, partial [Spirochaetota bacterium]|nr:diguanylate cyclase [Spirochaetota bacterium]
LPMANDIQKRKLIETEIQKSRESLINAQRIAHMGNWDWNILNNKLTWSDEIYRIFGLKGKEFSATYEGFLNYVHPDDREYLKQAVNDALTNKRIYNIDHRIILPNKTIRYVHEEGEVHFDEHKNPIRMIGTVQDITERKLVEMELSIASKILENIVEGVVITDPNAVIKLINLAYTTITGYEADEVIGKNPSIKKSGHQNKDFYKNMWDSLINHGFWQGEIWNKRKNGEIYPEWLSITAIKDDMGNITHYIGIFNDITGRKKYEDLIKYKAYHDHLTGLPNRLLFNEKIGNRLNKSLHEVGKMAIVFVDLDNYKNVNDKFGHDTGDELLIEVSKRLKKCIRKDDIAARIGGDEFILYFNHLERTEDIIFIANKILEVFKYPVIIGENEIFITSSIGISVCPEDGTNIDLLIKKADKAMYKAKEKGKNCFNLYSDIISGE